MRARRVGLWVWVLLGLALPAAAQEVPLAPLQERAMAGELEEVLATLQAMERPSPDALRLWAWLEACAGRQEAALPILNRLLAKNPGDRDSRQRRADALWAQGRLPAALKEYRELEASEVDPMRKESLSGSVERLATQASEQQSLRSSMSRLQRWYLTTGTLAVLLLAWGAVSSMRLWLRG